METTNVPSTQVFRLGEKVYHLVNNHFTKIMRFTDIVSNNIKSVIEESEAVFEFNITVAKGFFKLLILRMSNEESARSKYIMMLFQQLSNNNLILVMWRDINFMMRYIHFYNKKGKARRAYYLYHGKYVEVNDAYQKQDVLLFSYYIYALILSSIEKIDDFKVKDKVYLEAQNWSSVSEDTSHTKCPYCFYFDEVYVLKPNRNTWDPKNVEGFYKDRYANPYMYLSPEKRTRRDFIYMAPEKQKTKNISPSIEERLELGGKKYIAMPTRNHIHVENESPFINKVMKLYQDKKSRHNEESLGVQLITACQEQDLRKLLETSELTHNYKPLANAIDLSRY